MSPPMSPPMSTSSPMPLQHDHHPHEGSAVVARAERFSQAHGVSFTPMRRRVLDALLAAGVPVTAYDLADRLSTGRRIAPVQVYRVHRLATRSAFVACGHEHAQGETTVFLVCGACGQVAEVASPAVGRGLKGAAAASDFEAHHPVVEVEGRCASCRVSA